MNLFLATIRKIAIGGIIILILSLILKHSLPSGKLGVYVLVCIPVYLLFAFFTWLNGKIAVSNFADEYQVDLPDPNFLVTFFKGILFDVFSPVTTIFALFGDLSTKFIIFISTYIILGAYVLVWFFLVK